MPRPQTTWLPVSEVRLRLTSPTRGKPWAHKALFGPGTQAQSPKPPPPCPSPLPGRPRSKSPQGEGARHGAGIPGTKKAARRM